MSNKIRNSTYIATNNPVWSGTYGATDNATKNTVWNMTYNTAWIATNNVTNTINEELENV